jgi:integrase
LYQEAFRAGIKAAKINAANRRLTGHSFRHSLATALRDAGVAAEKMQAALGWRDTRTMDDVERKFRPPFRIGRL